MKKEEFTQKLNNHNVLGLFYKFVRVDSESDNESTLIALSKGVENIKASFVYEETGLIYRINVVDMGWNELTLLINTIKEILKGEIWWKLI